MASRVFTVTRIFGGLLFLVSTGCAFALDWDDTSEPFLPCLNGECDDNFTCLVNRCVPDATQPKGATCNDDVQCQQGLVCAEERFTCQRPCGKDEFYSSGPCGSGEYCQPVLVDDSDQIRTYEGVCVSGDGCQEDSECPEDRAVCVKITSTAFACRVGCQITWGNGVEYTDTCAGTLSDLQYCTPIGFPGDERLVCLSTTTAAPLAGNVCEPVSNPCRQELACFFEICRVHCNTELRSNLQCGEGELCCARPDGDNTYGVCAANCSF